MSHQARYRHATRYTYWLARTTIARSTFPVLLVTAKKPLATLGLAFSSLVTAGSRGTALVFRDIRRTRRPLGRRRRFMGFRRAPILSCAPGPTVSSITRAWRS